MKAFRGTSDLITVYACFSPATGSILGRSYVSVGSELNTQDQVVRG